MNIRSLIDDPKTRNRLNVPILLSTEHAEDAAQADQTVDRARTRLDRVRLAEAGRDATPVTDEARADLRAALDAREAAYEAAAEQLVIYTVQAIGSTAWQDLIDQHPPTDEQRAAFEPTLGRLQFNPRTLPDDAVAACLVDPPIDSIDDVRALRESIPDSVWQQIWAAVLRVNAIVNVIPPIMRRTAT